MSQFLVTEIKEDTRCDFIVPETRMLSCQVLETTWNKNEKQPFKIV